MSISQISKGDLLQQIKATGRALETDATNPHAGISLEENQRDEALIGNASGGTIDEMRSLSLAAHARINTRATWLAGAGLVAAVGAVAGFAITGTINYPLAATFVAAMGLAIASGKIGDRAIPEIQLQHTLDRWEKALSTKQTPAQVGSAA